MEEEFPRIALGMLDIGQQPRVKGAFQVFSIPTLLVYFENREMLRLSRGFSLTQLRAGLERPYRLFFE